MVSNIIGTLTPDYSVYCIQIILAKAEKLQHPMAVNTICSLYFELGEISGIPYIIVKWMLNLFALKISTY